MWHDDPESEEQIFKPGSEQPFSEQDVNKHISHMPRGTASEALKRKRNKNIDALQQQALYRDCPVCKRYTTPTNGGATSKSAEART